MTARVVSASATRNAAERSAPANAIRVRDLRREGSLMAPTRSLRDDSGTSHQPISHAAHGLDPRRLLRGVDLLSQARDQDVDRVGHRLLALAPGLLEDLLAADGGSGLAQERLQNRKLPRGQRQRLLPLPGRALARIELEIAADELRRRPSLVSAQERVRAGGEDGEVEGLAEIVVRSLGESLDRGLGVVERGEH